MSKITEAGFGVSPGEFSGQPVRIAYKFDKADAGQRAIFLRTATDEQHSAIDALIARNAELERLCDATYVAQGADAYNHACELMEEWQGKRRKAGKDPGCEGSLCDGLSRLHSMIAEIEAERDALTAGRDAYKTMLQQAEEDVSKLAADNLALREGLRIFTGAAYPVSVGINDRGHAWSEAYLDQALQEANELLARTSAAT